MRRLIILPFVILGAFILFGSKGLYARINESCSDLYLLTRQFSSNQAEEQLAIFDRCIKCYEDSLHLSKLPDKQDHYSYQLILTTREKADYYSYLFRLEEMLSALDKVKVYLGQYGKNIIAEARLRDLQQGYFNMMGSYYMDMGDFVRVDSIFSRAIEELRHVPLEEYSQMDSSYLNWALNYKASLAMARGEYTDAEDYLLNSKNFDRGRVQWTNKLLGDAYFRMENYPLAKTYYSMVEEKILAYMQANPSSSRYVNSISALYEKMSEMDLLNGKPDSAIQKMNFVIDLQRSTKKPPDSKTPSSSWATYMLLKSNGKARSNFMNFRMYKFAKLKIPIILKLLRIIWKWPKCLFTKIRERRKKLWSCFQKRGKCSNRVTKIRMVRF